MNTKVRFIKSSFLVSLFLFFLCISNLYAGGVLVHPRKVYVIKTNHFEIIFPKESADAAYFVAEKADSLYELAKSETGYKKDFFMPIIISPDSAVLDVKYTNYPYNRIVIFDANAGENAVIPLLYKEIFRAVSFSIRSPINELIHRFTSLGDQYQPVAFINLPFSFSEAYSDIASGTARDKYFQQLLIQAKLEGKFPSWLQAASVRDIYPGNDLCYAAGTGFAAFLMSTRGLEKYSEFWNECGELHPYLMNGIFHKVYGETLSDLWKEFRESIPQPQNIIQSPSNEFSQNDQQGAFENILCTNYGIVWYDRIRHEVDIFDANSSFKIRQLLFLAENVTKLSLSPDGRYISASFIRETVRPEFKEVITRIYDLREREFLDLKLELKDACFVTGADEQLLLAGLASEQSRTVLKVYTFVPDENDASQEKPGVQVYEKVFEKNQTVSCLCSVGKEKLFYILCDSDNQKVVVDNINWNVPASFWAFEDENHNRLLPLSVQASLQTTLQYSEQSAEKSSVITFSFYPEEAGGLARAGYVVFSDKAEGLEPEKLFIQSRDFSGGVYYPVISGDKLYYSSKKLSYNELCYVTLENMPFVEGNIIIQKSEEEPTNERSEVCESSSASQELKFILAEKNETDKKPLFFESEKKLGDYNLYRYNPFKYILDVSATPFLAVRDITLENGPILWPALGLYLGTDSDPMRNTELMISASADFLELYYEKEINTVPHESYERYNTIFQKKKKFNLAGYVENSSTPVDIAAGVFCNFNKSGDYNFKVVGKTAWKIPVGNIIRDMEFSIGSIYLSSTDYYDENKMEFHPPMEGWTVITDAYQLFEISATAKYSNSHQYGISQYERRGLEAGARIYSLWDIYEIRLLDEYRNKTQEQIKNGENTQLTEAQLKSIYSENLLNISQLNLGLFAEVEIPRLTPLEMYKGWVFSVPTTIRAELMNRTGTALDVNIESLLIGNEIQNGFPFLYLFFSRAGLKGGYNFKLDYDTTRVQLPDVRRKNYLADVFSQTEFSDSIYMVFNTDFLIPTGKLSEIQFRMDVRGEYFLRTNGFKFSFNVNAVF